MPPETPQANPPVLRVMALHALAYCERLFYLEEVEEIRVADHRVYAGRKLHLADVPDDGAEIADLTLESLTWGIRGKVDYLRYRDGALVPYEHKRGRSRGEDAWASDRLQVIAYAALLAEHLGRPISEGRVRYHANHKTIRIPIDDSAYEDLRQAISRARELASEVQRPPVTAHEQLCARCSLAPVCLPEEERLVTAPEEATAPLVRLFPAHDERQVVHITEPGSRVGKQGDEIVVTPPQGEPVRLPGRDLGALVLHGNAHITSHAIHYAIAHDIGVHWVTGGGRYAGGLAPPGGVQRRHRQFLALSEPPFALGLARRLVQAKVENQLHYLLRGARNRGVRSQVDEEVAGLRAELRSLTSAGNADSLRGHEGRAGRWYFGALPRLLDNSQTHMVFHGRSRRPPSDPFNAALSFAYTLLYRDVMAAIVVVGLDPAFGFFHAPRSAAWPLALDLMELFRTTLVDMPLVASINRQQWSTEHFTVAGRQVWLSDAGRRLAIEIYENRKQEVWRHPVVGYSLSYLRAIELEVRLLEKEWSGAPGLFARMRLRG